MTEGRRALLDRLNAIESGDECARWLPLLSALADGEASAAALAELRPHLRSCSACRATLRSFHAAPAQVAALVPAALVPLASGSGGSLTGHVELALHAVAERTTLVAMRLQGAFDVLPGAKLAAVAASTAALAGGGAAIEHATRAHHAPQTHVADVAAAPVTDATPIKVVVPLPRTASVFHARPEWRIGRRSEFTPPPAIGPEFTPAAHAAAHAPTDTTSSADRSSTAATPATAPAAPSTPLPPAEFAGP